MGGRKTFLFPEALALIPRWVRFYLCTRRDLLTWKTFSSWNFDSVGRLVEYKNVDKYDKIYCAYT